MSKTKKSMMAVVMLMMFALAALKPAIAEEWEAWNEIGKTGADVRYRTADKVGENYEIRYQFRNRNQYRVNITGELKFEDADGRIVPRSINTYIGPGATGDPSWVLGVSILPSYLTVTEE